MTDHLSRQPYIDLLKSIIANQREDSSGYSFAIDGEWGSGKTWILNELETQLDSSYLIFHYNAWENDFYDEPLVAIISVMIEKLNQVISQKSIYEAVIDELLKQASADLLTLVSGIVKEVTKIDIEKIITRKKDFRKKVKQSTKLSIDEINTLIPLQYTLKKVRDNLLKISKKLHVVLVVDELDRCLPEYAIKVLERLHHVCNKMPVIQILAIDKKNLADSIAKVFGKDYSQTNAPSLRTNLFCESYLQKFVDTIIPLPNGKIDSRIEILNELEKQYHPYIRPDNIGRDFLKVDNEFLAEFVSSLMNGIEKRLQEKIFKQVELCHKLTIQSGIQYEEDRITYAILIYEIISCICRYVYHSKESCLLITDKDNFVLSFHDIVNTSVLPETNEYVNFQKNIQEFVKYPVNFYDDQDGHHRYAFEIMDTKSYILAFFTEQEAESYDPLKRALWRWISEDKVFLKKYDEIMNILV